MPLNYLDQTDYSLLTYLQNNGRASNVQLASHLNLSETPSWRRHKNLESYEKLLRLTIRRLPGISSIKSNLSMREVKNSTTLPLPDNKRV